jgi:hypothetical protein
MAHRYSLSVGPIQPTTISSLEASLYEQVTTYVREEMNRADKLDNKKKNTVGFALTQLQRRLASSPEAIYQSLKRRRNRLKDKLAEMKLLARGQKAKLTGVAETLGSYTVTKQLDLPDNWDELDEDLSAEEYELYAEQVADQATAAETILELDAEILSPRIWNSKHCCWCNQVMIKVGTAIRFAARLAGNEKSRW